MIVGDIPQIDNRPADDIPPQMEKLRTDLADKGFPNASTEDVLSHASFPDITLSFFKNNR